MKVMTEVSQEGCLRVRLCNEQEETLEEWFINDAEAVVGMDEVQQQRLWLKHRIRSLVRSKPKEGGYSLNEMPLRF